MDEGVCRGDRVVGRGARRGFWVGCLLLELRVTCEDVCVCSFFLCLTCWVWLDFVWPSLFWIEGIFWSSAVCLGSGFGILFKKIGGLFI